MRSVYIIILLVILISGCIGPFSAEKKNMSSDSNQLSQKLNMLIINQASENYIFEFSVVPSRVSGIKIYYINGSKKEFNVDSLDVVPRKAFKNATKIVSLDENDVLTYNYNVSKNTVFRSNTKNIPLGSSVINFIFDNHGNVKSMSILQCDRDSGTINVSVTVKNKSVDDTVKCKK